MPVHIQEGKDYRFWRGKMKNKDINLMLISIWVVFTIASIFAIILLGMQVLVTKTLAEIVLVSLIASFLCLANLVLYRCAFK